MPKRSLTGSSFVAGLLLSVGVSGAQQTPMVQLSAPPPQATSPRIMATVTGHVTCSDTQQPARFATVTLVGVDQNEGGGFGRRVSGRTDLDGNFTMQAEPGDYYVTASATGYASPVAEAAARLSSGATSADLLARLPQVHVSDSGGGPVNVTIDRGGVISGKLQWDDGSPAAGVNVVAVSSTTGGTGFYGGPGQSDLARTVAQLGGFGMNGFQNSDDRGVFRITGLAPGSYLVRATVMTPSDTPVRGFGQRMTNVTFYAPGKVRRSDGQVIVIRSGEERDDLVFVIDLRSLHTVSGHVSSADEAGTVASGTVRLTDSQDTSLTRQAAIQADGSFSVQWVPAGNYTLSVANASSSPGVGYGRGQGGSSGPSYQQFQESLTVTDSDMTGLAIALVPATTASN
jgi:hypothetical protein